MTAAELIVELGKFPPHYPVVLITAGRPEFGCGIDAEWSFIGEVEYESNVGSLGSVVKIVAEDAQ